MKKKTRAVHKLLGGKFYYKLYIIVKMRKKLSKDKVKM